MCINMNPEEKKLYMKKWRQSPVGKRRSTIDNWKYKYKMVCDDWDKLYDYYINCKNCEWCDVELTQSKHNKKTTKCLDRDIHTGLFRNVICLSCNSNAFKGFD